MFRARGISGNKGQIDIRTLGTGKLCFRFFSSLLETLQSHFILRQINAHIFLEVADKPVNDSLVEIVASEVCVSIRRFHLENAIPQL